MSVPGIWTLFPGGSFQGTEKGELLHITRVVEAAPVAELLERLLARYEWFDYFAEEDAAIKADTQALLAALREHESRPP